MIVKTVYKYEVGDEVIGVDFSMACWEFYCESMGVALNEIGEVMEGKESLKAMRLLLTSGIKAYNYINDVDVEVTDKYVFKLMSKEPRLLFGAVKDGINALRSFMMGEGMEQTGQNKGDKKPTKKKSKT